MNNHTGFTTSIQLSHLLATEIGVNGSEAVVIDTIKNTDTPISLDTLPKAISNLFHVNISPENLSCAVHSLMTQQKLYQVEQILLISPKTLDEISRVSLDNKHIEKVALEEWIRTYQEQESVTLESDDEQRLSNSILSFVRTFFIRHGADCYKFIVGQKQNEYYDINSVAQSTSVSSEILGKNKVELFLSSIFTQNLSDAQTSFLLVQLKKAIHYLSMVVDQDTQSTMLSRMDGVSIYLDTTILYRLFNLQGEKRFESINQLVLFCQKANIKLKVFETTVSELKRRIAYDARVIINYPIPTSFAQIGYRCRTSENYISTFWKEANKTGVSAEDFNFRFSNVITLLENHIIEIDSQNYISEFGLEEIVQNLKEKVITFSSSDPEFEKSLNAVDHDAACLAMVSHLQEKHATSAIEAKTFFLSSDWSLIRLQRFDKEYQTKNDLVVLPSQLMQIFCMTSTTTDYYEAFLGLFSSSCTSFGTNTLENEQIQKIMGRVAMYRGTTPEFAEKVLSNQLIQSQFAAKETEEERVELIDNTMILTVKVMEEELESKNNTIQQSHNKLKQVTDRSKKDEITIEELSQCIESLEAAQIKTNENLSTKENVLIKYEKSFQKQANRVSRFKAVFQICMGILLLVFGICFLIISIMAFSPSTDQIVQPFFLWIHSSTVISESANITIIGTLITLSLAAISAGVFFVKPGYKNLQVKYFKRHLTSILEKI